MKVPFLKLLTTASICIITTTSFSVGCKVYAISKSDTMTSLKNLDNSNIKFFSYGKDMVAIQFALDKDYELVDSEISGNPMNSKLFHRNLELYGLKPNTSYGDLSLTLKDGSGNTYNLTVDSFKTPSSKFLGYSNVSIALSKGKLIAYAYLPENQIIDEIKSVSVSDSSVNASIADGQIVLSNLKNGKTYSNLILTIVDKNDNIFETHLNNFHIPASQLETLDVKVSSYKKNYIGEVILPEDIIVINASISDKNIVSDTVDGEVTLLELKEDTKYEDLILTVVDEKYQVHIFKLNTFSTVNKNFSYADVNVVKNENNINAKLLLPDDLIVSNAKISDSNIKFEIKNNELTLINLSSQKVYDNLKIIIQDKDGKLYNFVINEFSTSVVNVNLDKLRNYVKNAYRKAFNRSEIDEKGFEFWMEQLSLHKIGGRNFILNLLETDEFVNASKDSEDKILKIYEVMFNRNADTDGLKYWINEYEKDLGKTKSEKKSVSNIVKSMCDSFEFNRIISEIGIMS